LSAPLDAAVIRLNGRELKLEADDSVPELHAVGAAAGHVRIAPITIEFLAVPGADNPACR
jgi:heparanase